MSELADAKSAVAVQGRFPAYRHLFQPQQGQIVTHKVVRAIAGGLDTQTAILVDHHPGLASSTPDSAV